MSGIIIIGAWNTGTNLMWNILSNSKCINTISNKEIIIHPQHYNLWKHEPEIHEITKLIVSYPDNIIIIMYRNIFNWIASMLKFSYEVTFNDLNSTATIQRKNKPNIHFKNILELYIIYYSNYKNLIKQHKNVLFLNYNRIIDDNDIAFDYINFKLNKYNLSLNSYQNFIDTLNKPAKKHGKSVLNYLEAKNKKVREQNRIRSMIYEKYPMLKSDLNITKQVSEYYENEY